MHTLEKIYLEAGLEDAWYKCKLHLLVPLETLCIVFEAHEKSAYDDQFHFFMSSNNYCKVWLLY